MKRIKIEVHPSVLLVLLAMLGVIFFYSYKEKPEIIEVKRDTSVEKTWDEIYEQWEDFPSVETDNEYECPPIIIEDYWWEYDATTHLYKRMKDGKVWKKPGVK